ncbi:MAG: HAMP domain-containing histidine kinase [Epsilonproteobacteria bacterium]|nr:HAMP domain-containing histidine kinase [Campylobacterota bacterium]
MRKIFFIFLAVKLFAWHVLVINSYSPLLTWTRVQSHTIVKELQKSDIKDLDLYVEYMNTKKFAPTDSYLQLYFDFLNKKYHKIGQFDIVIVTDDNALNFVRRYKTTPLFKKSKVFFEGINNISLQNTLDRHTYAGVFETKNPLANFKLAKAVKPHLKIVYVVSDTTVSGDKTFKQYKSVFDKIKNVNFIYLHTSNLNQIIKKLKYYDYYSVLMMLTFGGMKYNGEIVTPKQAIKIVAKHYYNPIIIHSSIFANIPHTTIIGGDCTDAQQQAILNVKKVIKYIHHTPMSKLGFDMNNSNRMYLNVKNLQKFGIDWHDLPFKNVVLVNKPTSFFEIYKTEIITFFIILLLSVVFLIVLAKKNRDLYKYSQEIERLNKDLEQRIQQAIQENRKQEQLLFQQSKLAAMGEMIGAIAHQWKQPLNALAVNIQMLVDDYLDGIVDEQYMQDFEKKQMEIIQFMSKTIDDFRNFFRTDKEMSEFNLKSAIQATIKLVDKQLLNHGIQITLEGDDTTICGYENEFKQVVLNIINNAKDAILERGIQNGYIKIEINGTQVIIEDNAGGIDEDIKDRIFEPYFTTKDEGKGVGIGLYMSKTIIEEHMGGRLYFVNTQNGVRFVIEFKGF